MASPTALEHLQWAQRNETFYSDIGGDGSTSPDWAVTALFYAAVHHVQAALVYLPVRPLPTDHKSRKAAVRNQFRGISNEFEKLYDLSRQARYECVEHRKHVVADAHQNVQAIVAEIAKKAPPGAY